MKLNKPTLGKPSRADAALTFAEAAQPVKNTRIFNAPEGYRRLTINLPEDLHKKLRLVAVEQDCTAADIIERLLRVELKMPKQKMLP